MSDTLPPLPKGAVLVDDVPPLPQGAVLQQETAYDRFLTSLRNPQTGGRSIFLFEARRRKRFGTLCVR
jgi:hypothetical protein